MFTLPDPERCRACRLKGRVYCTRMSKAGFRTRWRKCATCGRRWPAYETVINPRRLVQRPR